MRVRHSPLIDEIQDKGPTAGASALEARTLCEAFQLTASERSGQVAHRTLDGAASFTFGEYAERVRALATGLHSLGVRRGDTVALMLVNRPEFALADTAAMHLGAIAFSVYNTLAPEQINYLLHSSHVGSSSRNVCSCRTYWPHVRPRSSTSCWWTERRTARSRWPTSAGGRRQAFNSRTPGASANPMTS